MGCGSSAPRPKTPRDRQAASLKSIDDPARFEELKQDPRMQTAELTVKNIQVQYGEMLCGICGCAGASNGKCCMVPNCGHRFHTACLQEFMTELMKEEIRDGREPKPVCPLCEFRVQTGLGGLGLPE